MPIILRDLPFYDTKATAVVHGRPISIKADQIIVGIGITVNQSHEFHGTLARWAG
jgi:hypothetical protein